MNFYVIFSDFKALFPLVYIKSMKKGSKITLVRYSYTVKAHILVASRPIIKSVVLNKLCSANPRNKSLFSDRNVSIWFVALGFGSVCLI